MKRLAICFLALMVFGVQGWAADLTGKWTTTLEDEGTKLPCVLTITKSDLLFAIDVEEDDEMGTISMSIRIPGSYTVDGNKLNIVLKKEGVEMKLGELKPKSEELKALLASPETKDALMGLIEGVLQNYKDQMMGQGNVLDGELTIKEVTATTMTLLDEEGQDVVFTRIE